jgi:hypothetical protein
VPGTLRHSGKKLAGVDAAISALNANAAPVKTGKHSWKMSAAARARISAAEKKRRALIADI